MRALAVASLLLLACQREPAIVVRFAPPDGAVAPRADLAHAEDAAIHVDAAKAAKKPDGKRVDHAECKVDDDCTLVPEACCDCANGGKLVAMTKTAAAQRAKKDCKNVMCTMMISTDPTCGSRPACLAGTCGMREARADEKRPPRVKLPAAQ